MPIYNVRIEDLPEQFPTHNHSPLFWESLGRTIATYGFLEEILLRAIFALSVTKEHRESDLELEYEKWLGLMERSLSDQLANLIDSFIKSARTHQCISPDIDPLELDLREASKLRNVLCHGSWAIPDSSGKSIPFFVNKSKDIFDTAIDINYLNQVQQHVKELSCSVINTVTQKAFGFLVQMVLGERFGN